MSLKTGQRDKNHRVFLGWKIRSGEHELSTDGHWYNVAGVWRDLEAAKAAWARELERFPDTSPPARFIRVFRPESQMRRALRELVDETGAMLFGISPAQQRAIELLRDTEGR